MRKEEVNYLEDERADDWSEKDEIDFDNEEEDEENDDYYDEFEDYDEDEEELDRIDPIQLQHADLEETYIDKSSEKPRCELIGTDGNVFALAGRVISCLKKNGLKSQAQEVTEKLFKCKSYDEALSLFSTYVSIY